MKTILKAFGYKIVKVKIGKVSKFGSYVNTEFKTYYKIEKIQPIELYDLLIPKID